MDLNKVRYVHTTKSGGSSIVFALRTVEPNTPHTHRPILSKKTSNKLGIKYTFATAIHPELRALDIYNYFGKIENNYTFDGFLETLDSKGFGSLGVPALHVCPQVVHLKNGDNEVDDIIRMETYEEDYKRIVNGVLGIKEPMPHKNKTKNQVVKKLTKKQKNLIYKIYEADYKYLGYEITK